MKVTDETITVEKQLELAQNGVKAAEKSRKQAQDALKSGAATAPPEELVKLSLAVTAAEAEVSRAEASLRIANSAVETDAWNKRAEVLAPILAKISPTNLTAEDRAALASFGIEYLVSTAYVDAEDERSGVKPFGEGVPKKAGSAKSSGGSRESTKGLAAAARTLLKAHIGEMITDKVSVQDVLDRPASYGLVPYAQRFAKKIGVELVAAE